MKIWVLMENEAGEEGFACEHGLSMLIEANGRRILFDMGQSRGFIDNAKRLGQNLAQVDLAVLSHGHYDHGGGLAAFLEVNSRAKVYISPHAFGEHYNAQSRYIGLVQSLAKSERLERVTQTLDLGAGFTLIPGSAVPGEVLSGGLQRMEQGRLVPEDFRHEQYLLIQEGERKILLSGCSHRGIVGICRHFRPDVLIGGFHLMKMDPQAPELERIGQELAKGKTLYYTGHCTGDAQFQALYPLLGSRLRRFRAGSTIVLL